MPNIGPCGPRIIESAKKEFLKNGYSQSSLQTICRHAGVTTGALYKRYTGKAELFEAILEPTVQRMLELSLEHDKENREFVESNTAKKGGKVRKEYSKNGFHLYTMI